ncbi:unnamed protein product, partial [Fusarium langsethiae]
MPNGFFMFFKPPVWGWYLSSTVILLIISWNLHNVISWLKNKPFLTKRYNAIYIGTIILVQPYWVLEIYANFTYFNPPYTRLFSSSRPLEALCRDPWWIFTALNLFWNIKYRYEFKYMELIRISPRFAVLLLSMTLSIIFIIIDLFAVTSVLHIGYINPFWKFAFIFKCFTDTIILDDFKTALDKLSRYKMEQNYPLPFSRPGSQTNIEPQRSSLADFAVICPVESSACSRLCRGNSWCSWNTDAVVKSSPYSAAVLANGRIPFEKCLKVESAELGDDLGTRLALGGLMKVHTALDQSFLGKNVRVLRIGPLGLGSFFRRSHIGLILLFRLAIIDLDTVRVTILDTRTVIMDSRVLEARYKDKSWETENNKSTIPSTHVADIDGIVSFTKAWHSKPYSSIDPSRPEISAAGKFIAITGGGTGIGKSIAIAFAQAGASTIAILGRRLDRLETAANEIA